MHAIRPFELGLIIVFVLAALIGVFVVANRESTVDQNKKLYGTSFMIWGTVDADAFDGFLRDMVELDEALEVVQYRRIDPRSFESELVNAIAEGKSPDMILLPHSYLALLRTKLQPLALESWPERDFRDAYVDGAGIFRLSDGVYGRPVAVDPLVMYWNRDLFASSGLANPPKTWEVMMQETVPALSRVSGQSVTQSALAFGEYLNVRNAKEILAMLMLQAGSTIVEEGNQTYRVTMNQGATTGLPPGESALSFYAQFADPTKAQYSWNRSKNEDRRTFLQGTLALYFGLGSEQAALERENPNLNFDMAEVPQGSGATIRRNYGEFYAFAIPRGSKNPVGAAAMGNFFVAPAQAQTFADRLGMAPVHRSLISQTGGDLYKGILNQAALIARGWFDPHPIESRTVFQQMVESLAQQGGRASQSVSDAAYRLQALF